MTSRIGTLRLRGAADGGPGIAASLGLRFGQADLLPPGLPPAAILVVRRLADPRPGSVQVRRDRADIDPAWEAAARAELGRLAGGAAWPARGAVPSDAAAVLFADRAELVASLLADMAAGVAATRWWWRLLLPEMAPRGSIAEVMLGETRALVEAVRILDRWRAAAIVVAALSTAEAGEALAAVLAAHGAPPLPPESPEPGDLVAPPEAAPARPDARPAPARGVAPPPWARWVGDDPSGLEPVQALLLGVVRLLHVRAAEVRRPEFAAAASHWLATAPHRQKGPPVGSTTPGGSFTPAGDVTPAGDPLLAGVAPAPPPARVDAPSLPGPPVRPPGDAEAAHPPGARAPASPGRGPNPALEPAAPPGRAISSPEPTPVQAPSEEPAAASRDGVATGLAGVLLLANVIGRLRLPDAFDRGWELPRHAGGWAVLEVLGRAMLAESWARDPVWDELAALDGRAGSALPGGRVPDGVDFSLPPDWWAPFSGERPAGYWAGRRGQIRLWTDLGFVLADEAGRALAGDAAELASRYALPRPRRRAFASAPLAALHRSAAAGVAPGMARWVALAEPCVRRLLADALAVGPGDVAAELLVRPGRIHASRTHVDVVLPLDAASVPVRRAGLDRDPGWLPELGRVVAFHFD